MAQSVDVGQCTTKMTSNVVSSPACQLHTPPSKQREQTTYLASVHHNKCLTFCLYTVVGSDDKSTLGTLLTGWFRDEYREPVVPTLIPHIILAKFRDEELV